MEKGMIEVNGIQLSVKEAGTGQDMILIHGKGYSKENMDRIFNHYKDRYHVVSYDVRGHGESDKPARFTLQDDVNDLVDKMHLMKPIVIGFSMGSYITLKTAEEYPELFSRIVIIGTKGGGSTSSTQKVEQEAITNSLQDFDLLADADKVTIPVLALTGEYDGLNPPEEGKKVADALPNARFETIPNAGHIAFFENPEKVFSLIDDFLK